MVQVPLKQPQVFSFLENAGENKLKDLKLELGN